MQVQFVSRPTIRYFFKVLILVIVFFSLIIPNLAASYNNLNYPDKPINSTSENILWSTALDVSSDSAELFSLIERADFEKCFGQITFTITEFNQVSDARSFKNPTSSAQLQDTKLASELQLLESSPVNIIRGLNQNNLDLEHSFEKTTELEVADIGPTYTFTPGIKQTITLYNPTPNHRNFRASYKIETVLDILKWNDKLIYLPHEKMTFGNDPAKVTLLNDRFIEQCNFDWSDLTAMGLSPETIGYRNNGKSVIECTLDVSLEPWATMELDPSYNLVHVSSLKLYNEEEWGMMGSAIATGDFNNDSYDDLAFTAPEVWTGPSEDRFRTGEIYLLFGKPRQNLGNYLNFSYSEDIVIYGASEEDNLNGATLVVGDINNDGFDDLVIGAPMARTERGLVYVIFGNTTMKKLRDFGTTSDADIKITGSDDGGETGTAVAIGDINGDGFGDIILGSPKASYGSGMEARDQCGKVHVIYGNTTMDSSYRLRLQDHYNMHIFGESTEDYTGMALAAGDINGDGTDDIVIGSPEMDAGYDRLRDKAGTVNVIFGNDNLSKEWDLRFHENITEAQKGMLHGNITIIGDKDEFQNRGDRIGATLEVADLNNDNFDDMIIGAPYAKGKSGFGNDVGEVYIIYGDTEANLLRLIDIKNITRDGYLIYGKDNGDLFGSSLEANDISGDGIRDIIIGAPGAWGVSDDLKETGEVYIMYGDSQKIYGYQDDLVGSKDILIFYGDKKDEESGYALASGDLDNDGRGEIIVGTPRAESANGTLLEVGRIDIIFELNVTSQISHVSYSLVDGGGTNGDICYAGAEHTFRVRVAHSKGITQLNFTQLSLEPLGPNIQFRWYQGNNSFFEISDRFGYASLNTSSSTSRKISNNIYELDFRVIFNFKYPPHRMSAIQFYSLGDNLSVPAAIDKYEDIFQVENALKFVGELSAVGSYQGKLKEGDRVHSLEKITWAGLKVVYNGTTDLYPGDEYFDVSVWDDDGDSWTDQYSSGEEIEIVSEADAVDDPSDTHTINITNIPDFGEGFSEVKFEINVEATKIAFTEHKPDSNVWHNNKNITCSIVISDTAGWEINGSSIEYSISTNGAQEDNFSPWTSAGQTGQQMSYSVSTNCEFENGDDNFIRWRAKNVASQIYGGSVPFQVRVDIEPVYYSNPIPAQSEWQYSTSVECGIIVSDNLSGVNKDSIQYRYKDPDMSEFNAWSRDGLNFQENEDGFEVKVTIDFKPGIDNFIQWSAVDVLGNSDLGSSQYRLRITTDKPISILSKPLNGATVQDIDVTVRWTGKDPNDDTIIYDIYFSYDIGLVTQHDPTVRIAASISDLEYTITDLENGGKYYWAVIPFDNKNYGECQSGVWEFIVYLPPPITNLVLPGNGSTINTNSMEFLWELEYIGLEQVKFDLYIDTIFPPIAEPIVTGLTTNSYRHTGLEDGKTYFWFVVPKVDTLLGEVKGESQPTVFELTVDFDVRSPEVVLKKPEDGILLTTQQPTLEWDLVFDSPERENVTFIILLDTVSNPAFILTDGPVMGSNFTIGEPLEYNVRYYWKVIPKLGEIEGECTSGVWSFIITPIIPGFEIELSLEKDLIESYPGSTGELKFTITNLANINDTIIIKFDSPDFNESNINIIPDRFELSSGAASSGTITILIPKNIELKNYEISIIASSEVAADFGTSIQTKKSFTLSVSKEADDGKDESNMVNYLVVVIIIIIILVIIGLYRSRQGKKGLEPSKPKPKSQESDVKSKSASTQKPKSGSSQGKGTWKKTGKATDKDKDNSTRKK